MSSLISVMSLLNKLLMFVAHKGTILEFSKTLTEPERKELIIFADNIENLYKLIHKDKSEDAEGRTNPP